MPQPEQPQELKDILALVKDRAAAAEANQKDIREQWNVYYGLYRNYRDLKKAMRGAGTSERDRDLILQGNARTGGAELFIPYAFTTVETVVPRVLSNDPKMIVPPRREDSMDAALRVQALFEQQQKEIDYELKLQAVARSGLKYGLGVMKTGWEVEKRLMRQNKKSVFRRGFQTIEQEVVLREGPTAEAVDIWDFLWEPDAHNIASANYVIHRVWLTNDEVKQRVEDGTWLEIDLESLPKSGGAGERAKIWAGRREASGLTGSANPHSHRTGDNVNEVWEYHDGTHVYTILNRELVVQNDTLPYFHREIPFQIYRPTPVENEFVGIGEIEPIVHLQYELNALRSMRMDNANLLINKAFVYAEGFVNPDDLKVGPGMGIPVSGTDISRVLQPLDFGEIPNSGYREEQALKEDIERASGVSDSAAGGGGGSPISQTATGIQIVQQSLGIRTQLKTKNLERELIRHAGRQWMELNRQYILDTKPVRTNKPDGEGFEFSEVEPEDLSPDEVDFPEPEGGSTEPDNPTGREQKAVQMYTMLSANEKIEQSELALHLLSEFGVTDPQRFIAQPLGVPVDPRVLGEELVSMGIPEDQVLQALQTALQAAVPGAQGEAPGPEPDVSPNGAEPPEPEPVEA